MALHPVDDFAQKAVFLLAEAGDAQDDLLDRDAGEDGLVHQNGGKNLAVPGEKFLQKSGAAAGWGDNKNRLADDLPPEARKKNVIQSPPNCNHHPKRREEQHESGHNHPASEPERLAQIRVKKRLGG